MIAPGGEGEQHARAEEVVDTEEENHANLDELIDRHRRKYKLRPLLEGRRGRVGLSKNTLRLGPTEGCRVDGVRLRSAVLHRKILFFNQAEAIMPRRSTRR